MHKCEPYLFAFSWNINLQLQKEFNPDIILDIVRLKTVNSYATVI